MGNKTVRMLMSISMNLLIIVVSIYIIITVGSKAYTFGTRIFNEQALDTPENARSVEITIKKGITAKELSKLLHDKGLVQDELVAYCQIEFSDYKKKFVEGTYVLSTDMKPTQMMQIMCKGNEEQEQELEEEN